MVAGAVAGTVTYRFITIDKALDHDLIDTQVVGLITGVCAARILR